MSNDNKTVSENLVSPSDDFSDLHRWQSDETGPIVRYMSGDDYRTMIANLADQLQQTPLQKKTL